MTRVPYERNLHEARARISQQNPEAVANAPAPADESLPLVLPALLGAGGEGEGKALRAEGIIWAPSSLCSLPPNPHDKGKGHVPCADGLRFHRVGAGVTLTIAGSPGAPDSPHGPPSELGGPARHRCKQRRAVSFGRFRLRKETEGTQGSQLPTPLVSPPNWMPQLIASNYKPIPQETRPLEKI